MSGRAGQRREIRDLQRRFARCSREPEHELARVAAESRFLDEKPRSRARPLQFGSITTEHEDNAMIDQENQFTTIETDQLNRVIGGAGVFEDNLEPAGRTGGAAL